MTVNPEPLLVRADGGVVRISLNRPEKRNAVDGATAAALHGAIGAATADPGCRVVVIAGEGPAFCAGWDIEAIAQLRAGNEASIRADFEANRELLHDLATLPQATVAAAHGAVLGFGIGLLAACDIAIAGRSTAIGLPEIALGVVPGMVMLDVREALPAKVALDWLLSGERRSAEEALAAGMVSRVVDDADLERTVDDLARRLAGHDPETLRETKALFRRLGGLDRGAAEAEAITGAVRALLRS